MNSLNDRVSFAVNALDVIRADTAEIMREIDGIVARLTALTAFLRGVEQDVRRQLGSTTPEPDGRVETLT